MTSLQGNVNIVPRVLDIGMEKDNAKCFTISNIFMPSIICISLNLIFLNLSQFYLIHWLNLVIETQLAQSDSGSEMIRVFWVGYRLKIISSAKAGGEKEPHVGLKIFCVHGRR